MNRFKRFKWPTPKIITFLRLAPDDFLDIDIVACIENVSDSGSNYRYHFFAKVRFYQRYHHESVCQKFQRQITYKKIYWNIGLNDVLFKTNLVLITHRCLLTFNTNQDDFKSISSFFYVSCFLSCSIVSSIRHVINHFDPLGDNTRSDGQKTWRSKIIQINECNWNAVFKSKEKNHLPKDYVLHESAFSWSLNAIRKTELRGIMIILFKFLLQSSHNLFIIAFVFLFEG